MLLIMLFPLFTLFLFYISHFIFFYDRGGAPTGLRCSGGRGAIVTTRHLIDTTVWGRFVTVAAGGFGGASTSSATTAGGAGTGNGGNGFYVSSADFGTGGGGGSSVVFGVSLPSIHFNHPFAIAFDYYIFIITLIVTITNILAATVSAIRVRGLSLQAEAGDAGPRKDALTQVATVDGPTAPMVLLRALALMLTEEMAPLRHQLARTASATITTGRILTAVKVVMEEEAEGATREAQAAPARLAVGDPVTSGRPPELPVQMGCTAVHPR